MNSTRTRSVSCDDLDLSGKVVWEGWHALGIDDEVDKGSRQQDPAAALVAQDMARTEDVVPKPAHVPAVDTVARRMEPKLFARKDAIEAKYDALHRQLIDLRPREATPAKEGEAALDYPALVKRFLAVADERKALDVEVAAIHRRAAEAAGSEMAAPEPSLELTPASYVDMYFAGMGRENSPRDFEIQQYAKDHAAEIEEEFARRKAQAAAAVNRTS